MTPAEVVAEFWAQWLPPAMQVPFRLALLQGEHERLECGDDPDSTLLTALRAVGLQCRGKGNSVLDVGFPFHTHTQIDGGTALVSWGKFSELEPITETILAQVGQLREARRRIA